jgi:hypothetical protein
MSRVLVSTKSHNNGNVVAQVFRGDEGVGEYFSIDFVSASRNPFITPRCKSQEEVEDEAGRRLRAEGHRLRIGDQFLVGETRPRHLSRAQDCYLTPF